MRFLRTYLDTIIISLFEIVAGILLMIKPVEFTSGIIIFAGVILMILGLTSIIKYFFANAGEAALRQLLSKGIIAILIGIFCAFNTKWFISVFPILTVVYGVLVLFVGVHKVQLTIDCIRLKTKKWYLPAISAILSIALAIVIIANPFTSTQILWCFTGITIIVEAVCDIVAMIVDACSNR